LKCDTDNVAAGVQAGEMMKEAMPEGGDAMLFVGRMDNANARERVEGIRTALEGSNINIVDVRTDEIDFVKARRNVEDTLTAYPEIDMLVGLYSYNPPQIIEAMAAAGMTGMVKIIGFDEDVVTLRGIDVGAKAEIYALMRDLADRGTGILMISSDLEEVIGVSDRIAVMCEGRIGGLLERADFSEGAVMRLAVGMEAKDAA